MNFLLEVAAFAYRNYIFAKRNVFMVVEMIFWPVMGLLSIGLLSGFIQLEERTLNFVLTGAVASGVLQINQLDVGYSLLYDVWAKSIKHTFLSGTRVSAMLLGSWLIGIVRGILIFAFLTFLARAAFGFTLPPIGPLFIFLIGIFWMGLISGMAVWVLILLYGQRAEISVWAMSYLLMIICGIYYPVDLLPEPVRAVALLIPLTYFLDAVRTHYGFASLFTAGLVKGVGLSVLYTVIGIWGIRRALQRAHFTGMLLRLSE